MPGIFGTNINKSMQIMPGKNRIFKNLFSSSYYLELSSIKKFENDKGLFEDDDYILLIDGVVLNLSSLLLKYNVTNLFLLTKKMYKSNIDFFKDFRGPFCGFFKDKKSNKVIIFTNHFGDKAIYYYQKDKKIIFSSEIKYIIQYMKQENISYHLDEASIYCMLTYGYMYSDITPIKEIKRLLPGSYIIFDNKFDIKQYYNFKKNEVEYNSENEILEKLDSKFRSAVYLQIEKNKEYGYYNYAPLSAGLDSRMTNYVLRDMYDGDIYNMTYSETNQLDYSVPACISRELKNHWLFKNLDNGLALKDIKNSFYCTDGVIYYAWPSQLNDYMSLINTEKMGIVHTGVIGDVIIGTFFKKSVDEQYKLGDGAFSSKLIDKLKSKINLVDYANQEEGMMYNRACNGAILGYSIPFQYYTECMSPFMDVDFVDFCLSLPIKYRFQHNIYYKWVNKYYPNAAKYPRNGVKIPNSKMPRIHFGNKTYSIDTIFGMLKAKLRAKTKINDGMNPMDYWYKTNDELRKVMDDYYKDKLPLVKNEELKNDIVSLYNNGNAIEKIQVISALSIIEHVKGDKNAI